MASCFMPRCANDLAPRLDRYSLRAEGYVLCVSTTEPRKRIDALLEAYRRLPVKMRAAYPLVLVGGRGWRNEKLHALIDKAQRAGWLHYLGFVPEVDLPMHYADARLVAYPSIYEGFGLPVARGHGLWRTGDYVGSIMLTRSDDRCHQTRESG